MFLKVLDKVLFFNKADTWPKLVINPKLLVALATSWPNWAKASTSFASLGLASNHSLLCLLASIPAFK